MKLKHRGLVHIGGLLGIASVIAGIVLMVFQFKYMSESDKNTNPYNGYGFAYAMTQYIATCVFVYILANAYYFLNRKAILSIQNEGLEIARELYLNGYSIPRLIKYRGYDYINYSPKLDKTLNAATGSGEFVRMLINALIFPIGPGIQLYAIRKFQGAKEDFLKGSE